jgi:hypothetical protein
VGRENLAASGTLSGNSDCGVGWLNRHSHELETRLKRAGDLTYKRFLNPYGDSIFCRFEVRSDSLTQGKGIYCFCARGGVVYIGRSRDPIQKRINQGYGTIHPKNCFLDGQATNCHVNALIASQPLAVSCFACPLTEDGEIEECERLLICKLNPHWNIALKQRNQIAHESGTNKRRHDE